MVPIIQHWKIKLNAWEYDLAMIKVSGSDGINLPFP